MPTICRLALVAAVALWALVGCDSKPDNPYPAGYPQQGFPQQGYPQPGQQAAPGYPAPNALQPAQPQPTQPLQPAAPLQPQPAQPLQPGVPGQPVANPMAGLAGALGQAMGQAMGQAGQVQPAPTGPQIPWQSLSQALPTTAAGWKMSGQVEGETAVAMGISVSTARCKLVQGGMQADIEIIDNAMAAGMAAMGFAMVPTIDSSEERMGRINMGAHPGMQTFHKKTGKADIVVIVSSRVMVNVNVTGVTSEGPAMQLAQQVNYAHLLQQLGG